MLFLLSSFLSDYRLYGIFFYRSLTKLQSRRDFIVELSVNAQGRDLDVSTVDFQFQVLVLRLQPNESGEDRQ